MNKIYLITGPAGVGKSTTSKIIASSLEKSCWIEGDDIYHFVKGGYVSPWLEGNHLKLFWKNCISIMSNFINEGFDIVFNYIISKDNVKEIVKNFPNAEIKFVVLLCDEKTIVERDNLRPEDCRMGERSLILLKEMQDENFDDNYILYTSNQTETETVNEILNQSRFIIKS